MEETPVPPTSRDLATRGDMLPVRAEAPITVVQTRRGAHPAIYIALGMLIGVGGTALALGKRDNDASRVVRNSGPVRVPNPVVPRVGAQSVNPKGAPEPEAGTVGALTAGPAVPNPAPTEDKPNANEPMDPFAGVVLPSLPMPRGDGSTPPFRGMILPKDFPRLPPSDNAPARKPNPLDDVVAGGIPKAPPVLPLQPTNKEDAKSVTVKSMPTANFQAAADNLIAHIAKAGGKAQAITEKGDGDKPVVRGVQASVPDKAMPDVLRYAALVGATMTDRSSDPAERSQRMAQEAESKLASLKKLREALLVTYLEDAQPVKDVDEDIVAAQKAVDEAKAAKPPAEKLTTVRFAFGR
ncbi:MAG: hypothetical protein ACO1SV_25700 [Fimbriimonas sp.]